MKLSEKGFSFTYLICRVLLSSAGVVLSAPLLLRNDSGGTCAADQATTPSVLRGVPAASLWGICRGYPATALVRLADPDPIDGLAVSLLGDFRGGRTRARRGGTLTGKRGTNIQSINYPELIPQAGRNAEAALQIGVFNEVPTAERGPRFV